MKINVPTYHISLVRDVTSDRVSPARLACADDLIQVLKPVFDNADRECFYMVAMDLACKPIGINCVSVGTLDSALAMPREAFKTAVLLNAGYVAFAHNHPSGDATPSSADINTTARLIEAGQILGIPVVDHIIFSADGTWSMNDRRSINF